MAYNYAKESAAQTQQLVDTAYQQLTAATAGGTWLSTFWPTIASIRWLHILNPFIANYVTGEGPTHGFSYFIRIVIYPWIVAMNLGNEFYRAPFGAMIMAKRQAMSWGSTRTVCIFIGVWLCAPMIIAASRGAWRLLNWTLFDDDYIS